VNLRCQGRVSGFGSARVCRKAMLRVWKSFVSLRHKVLVR
jgi:hypothetical protein